MSLPSPQVSSAVLTNQSEESSIQTKAHEDSGRAEVALELRDVTKEYPGSPPVRALNDVSLKVRSGELAAIVGPSGSGKSTMLHVMGTLDRPSKGRVYIDGLEVSRMSDRRLSAVRSQLIGFVFQQFFLIDGSDAVENVANGLLYSGVPAMERRERAGEALDKVGLGSRLTHLPNELSGGERQRVAIARAIVHDPAIVLADEPTGNLDTGSSQSIMELLHGLNNQGSTLVVITHDVDLANSLPRQVAFRDGQIVSDQTVTRETYYQVEQSRFVERQHRAGNWRQSHVNAGENPSFETTGQASGADLVSEQVTADLVLADGEEFETDIEYDAASESNEVDEHLASDVDEDELEEYEESALDADGHDLDQADLSEDDSL